MRGQYGLAAVGFYILLVQLTAAFQRDSNVAGYRPFSRLESGNNVIGLLWTINHELHSSRCFERQQFCEEGRMLYRHNATIRDMDVYFDGHALYLSDVVGGVYCLNLSSSPPRVQQLRSDWLIVDELSVDWLTKWLYVTTTSAQIYRCDMTMKNCLPLHSDPLPYRPKSLVADRYNGYLYWLDDSGALLKHDLSGSLAESGADVAITSNVLTYSVTFDHYDLYSISKYNDTHTEITLTYLDGENQRTHTPLKHPANTTYTELNCFHDEYCMWLNAVDDSTHLCWHLYNRTTKQSVVISNLNLTSTSLMKQWHRQVQPIPVPQIQPQFTDIYIDSKSMQVYWEPPDVLTYLSKASGALATWQGVDSFMMNKYMQSEAAWSDWAYELNITSVDGTYLRIIPDYKDLMFFIDNLNASSNYILSILASNDMRRSPIGKASVRTLSADPNIYLSNGTTLESIDVFGNFTRIWNLGGLKLTICALEPGENGTMYVLSSGAGPRCALTSTTVLQLDISAERPTVVHKLADVTAISYDWIGQMLYVGIKPKAISRLDNDFVAEPLTKELSGPVSQLSIDSLNGLLYWSTRDKLYSCKIGPRGSCGSGKAFYTRPAFRTMHGPYIDVLGSSLYWLIINSEKRMELLSATTSSSMPSGSLVPSVRSFDLLSYGHFLVEDGRLYLIQPLNTLSIDLRPDGLTATYYTTDAALIAYASSRSHPLLPGMNSTDALNNVLPEVQVSSIQVVGTYNNFSVQWALTSPTIASIAVQYIISVQEEIKGTTLFQSVNHTGTTTPYFTSLQPQTNFRISLQPYTRWKTGRNTTIVLETPSAEPGVPWNVGLFIRRMYMTNGNAAANLIIRWRSPTFTGGVIQSYNVTLRSQAGNVTSMLVIGQLEAEMPVSNDIVYNVSVAAQTAAGYGNQTEIVTFNTSLALTLPLISAITYTPESIDVKWKLSNLEQKKYNYTVQYKEESGTAAEKHTETVTFRHEFHTMKSLRSDTTFSIQMLVCCTSAERSLWFAGRQCEYTNTASSTTFIAPHRLRVISTSRSTISLVWLSPYLQQVEKHYVRFKPVGNEAKYRTTEVTKTAPNFNYTITPSDLSPHTNYEIALILNYPNYMAYSVPKANEKNFIVRTNQSEPGSVSISSAECGEKTCLIQADGDLRNKVSATITCDGSSKPLTIQLNSDGTKIVQRSRLPEDITECAVTARGTNTVGKGEMSPAVSLTQRTVSSTDLPLIISLSVIFGLLSTIGIPVLCYCYYLRNKRRKQQATEAHYNSQTGLVRLSTAGVTDQRRLRSSASAPFTFSLTENSLYDTEGVILFRESVSDDKAELEHYDREKLFLTKFLGSGAFGEVYEGKAKEIVAPNTITLVAVKTLRADASTAYKEEFIKEAKLMSQFDNEYIVRLLGVCIERDPYYIILELMSEGDLVGFLRQSRPTQEKAGSLSLSELVSVCTDVAAGCKYLEMLHFVHRDLAARNCLVSRLEGENQYRVKIGDFGLARDIYRNDYYRKEGEALLPVRWMSPEALIDGVFTSQSDIWAFGVLMWEVFTLAMQPYPARSNIEVLKFVTSSGTLDKPVRCPQLLFEIMLCCWSFTAADRPTFQNIFDKLNTFSSELMTSEVLGQFVLSNARLASENEFFAGSASSGAGVGNVSTSESPVFDHELNFDDSTKAASPPRAISEGPGEERHFEFPASTSSHASSSTPFQSLKQFFTRKPKPRYLLERVQSMPVEVTSRQLNRYVRSNSTMSADGIRGLKTYTQDGRQVSFDETSSIDSPMKPISEEKMAGNQLRVDTSVKSRASSEPAQPTVQYSTMTFDPATESGKTSPEFSHSVQYSAMAFDKHMGSAALSSAATVQYSAMAFGEQRDNKSGDSESPSSSASVDSIPMQYSTMAFNPLSSKGAQKGPDNNNDPQIEAGSSPHSSFTDENVNYSTMAFGGEKESQMEIPTETKPVQYSSISFGAPLNSADNQSVQYSAMAFNAPTSEQATNESASLVTNQKQCLTLPREATPTIKSTPVIESTPLGTRVNYASEQFNIRHSPVKGGRRGTRPPLLKSSKNHTLTL